MTSSYVASTHQPIPATYNWTDLDPTYQTMYSETTTYLAQPSGTTVITEKEAIPGKKKKPGFLARISNTLDHVVHRSSETLGLGNETSSRWGLFGLSDNLLAEFPCKLLNGNTGVRGYMFVSQNYLCFASHTDASHRLLKFMTPLSNVVSLHRASKVRSKGTAPLFVPMTDQSAVPDALQIVTTDNLMHQFFGFGGNMTNAFNILNHSWSLIRGGQHTGQYGVASSSQSFGVAPTQGYATTGTIPGQVSGMAPTHGYTTTGTIPGQVSGVAPTHGYTTTGTIPGQVAPGYTTGTAPLQGQPILGETKQFPTTGLTGTAPGAYQTTTTQSTTSYPTQK